MHDTDRRTVIKTTAAAAGLAAAPAHAIALASSWVGASPQVQPPLPYADTAFEPVISAKTFGFHYGKHHKGYYDTLAKLVKDTPMADATLESIILDTAGDADKTAIFNNAAQCWNHNFYWDSLSPKAQAPKGPLLDAINRDFKSVDDLKAALVKAATGQFGSGWAWLASDNGALKVLSTGNAGVPFTEGLLPLLTIDVWEHAYYLDWQNRRPDHVKALVDGHLNWDFAARNYARG